MNVEFANQRFSAPFWRAVLLLLLVVVVPAPKASDVHFRDTPGTDNQCRSDVDKVARQPFRPREAGGDVFYYKVVGNPGRYLPCLLDDLESNEPVKIEGDFPVVIGNHRAMRAHTLLTHAYDLDELTCFPEDTIAASEKSGSVAFVDFLKSKQHRFSVRECLLANLKSIQWRIRPFPDPHVDLYSSTSELGWESVRLTGENGDVLVADVKSARLTRLELALVDGTRHEFDVSIAGELEMPRVTEVRVRLAPNDVSYRVVVIPFHQWRGTPIDGLRLLITFDREGVERAVIVRGADPEKPLQVLKRREIE